MDCTIFAVAWDELFRLLPIIVAVLVWVISHFAGQAPKKPPQRNKPATLPNSPKQAKPANESLQSEIDEFLKQAKAVREGKAATEKSSPRKATSPLAGEGPSKPLRPVDFPPQKTSRRLAPTLPKRGPRREEARPVLRPQTPSIAPDLPQNRPVRESVAQHVAETLDNSKFARRATQLSQVQQDSDNEFKQHMQRVFQRELGTLKTESAGIFEAAAATAADISATALAKATASAAGSQSATAPTVARKGSSDIALFLAGRKNMRDAIILSEIMQRPEQRWEE
jgi:hypothetical protein